MKIKKIVQFGFNVRVPEGIPVVDCRVIENPYGKHRDDREARFAVRRDKNFPILVAKGLELAKDHEIIGIGCGYGVHRSAEVVRFVQDRLLREGHDVEVENIGKRP